MHNSREPGAPRPVGQELTGSFEPRMVTCQRPRFRISRVVIIDGGHFVWEEASAQYGSAVLDPITDSWP
jgi:hypothetical protein